MIGYWSLVIPTRNRLLVIPRSLPYPVFCLIILPAGWRESMARTALSRGEWGLARVMRKIFFDLGKNLPTNRFA